MQFCNSQSDPTIVSDKESVNLTRLSDFTEKCNIIRNFCTFLPPNGQNRFFNSTQGRFPNEQKSIFGFFCKLIMTHINNKFPIFNFIPLRCQ